MIFFLDWSTNQGLSQMGTLVFCMVMEMELSTYKAWQDVWIGRASRRRKFIIRLSAI